MPSTTYRSNHAHELARPIVIADEDAEVQLVEVHPAIEPDVNPAQRRDRHERVGDAVAVR